MAWTDVVSVAIGESTKASTINGVIDNIEFRRNVTNGDFTSIYVDTASDGSAAAPFLRRNATADGLFFASGVIGLAIGGAELARITNAGLLLASNKIISTNTSDAADNGYLGITGAGALGSPRGAFASFYGNEYTATGGELDICAGNTSTGHIKFFTGNDAERMRITYSGKLLIGTAVDNSLLTLLKDNTISTNTSDAADNGYLGITGAGALGSPRGAFASFYGNEYTAVGGELDICAGNTSTGHIKFFTGNDAERMRIGYNGEIKTYGIHNNGGTGNASNGCIASGSGSVAASTTTNLDSTPTVYYNWMRVGNVVTMNFEASTDATSVGVSTNMTFTPPVSSNFANTYDASAVVANESNTNASDGYADTANDRIFIRWIPSSTTANIVRGIITYIVI